MTLDQRVVWFSLGMFALNVGVHAGVAFATEGFWLHPTVAIFALVGTAGAVAHGAVRQPLVPADSEGTTVSTRSLLYLLARLLGDANAVKRGTVGKRIVRRAAGKVTGRGLGRIFG